MIGEPEERSGCGRAVGGGRVFGEGAMFAG